MFLRKKYSYFELAKDCSLLKILKKGTLIILIICKGQ